MNNKKLILAYSGGLDTSVIIKWLSQKDYEVIALCLDLGQKVDNLDEIKQKALDSGATTALVEDVKDEFVFNYVLPSLQFHATYEGVYLLGTALARPLIAKKQIEIAQKYDAKFVAHGATGKGNDQVRFELAYYSLCPEIGVVAPWKIAEFFQKYPGRQELIEYAKKHNIPIKAKPSASWSSDENLLHISYESGILENPNQKPPQEMFEWSNSPKMAPDEVETVTIFFTKGTPTAINGENHSPTTILTKLNELGSKHGIGRVDLVESRFVGMKSRGVYETPGGTILMQAHRAIESICLTGDVIDLKENLMPRFAKAIYQGFWFTPQVEILLTMLKESQQRVTGEVSLELYKGNVTIIGRSSRNSLYNEDLASMEEDSGNYSPEDATGFIKLNALPYRVYNFIKNQHNI